jgi:hypothetical protein
MGVFLLSPHRSMGVFLLSPHISMGVFLLSPRSYKLFGFPVFLIWAYPVNVILETLLALN